ncbi:uncharacterized protein C10orf67 homolog, mitochondrial isoform X2 [Macrotis lagotis]|uniref:uncharacterized protein C10orf67 homolog, mitochondrial isoform X2 n=1 Tax=Macrotis lagotis TaxID=92651 RepID=UPI003D695513
MSAFETVAAGPGAPWSPPPDALRRRQLCSRPSEEQLESCGLDSRVFLSDDLKIGYFTTDRATQTDVSEILELRELSNATQKLVKIVHFLQHDFKNLKSYLEMQFEDRLREESMNLFKKLDMIIQEIVALHEKHFFELEVGPGNMSWLNSNILKKKIREKNELIRELKEQLEGYKENEFNKEEAEANHKRMLMLEKEVVTLKKEIEKLLKSTVLLEDNLRLCEKTNTLLEAELLAMKQSIEKDQKVIQKLTLMKEKLSDELDREKKAVQDMYEQQKQDIEETKQLLSAQSHMAMKHGKVTSKERLTPKPYEERLLPSLYKERAIPSSYEEKVTPRSYKEKVTQRAYEKKVTRRSYEEKVTPSPIHERATPRALDERATPRALDERVTSRALDERATLRALDERVTRKSSEEKVGAHKLPTVGQARPWQKEILPSILKEATAVSKADLRMLEREDLTWKEHMDSRQTLGNQIQKLKNILEMQQKYIKSLQTETDKDSKMWERKYLILRNSFHALKNEMFTRQTIVRQFISLPDTSFQYYKAKSLHIHPRELQTMKEEPAQPTILPPLESAYSQSSDGYFFLSLPATGAVISEEEEEEDEEEDEEEEENDEEEDGQIT